MMGQPKPFAALSSGLLARKGQARPAMRPQGFSGFGAVADAIDDLGWNDMGHGDVQAMPNGPVPAEGVILPPVLMERRALSDELQAKPVTASSRPAPEPEQRRGDATPSNDHSKSGKGGGGGPIDPPGRHKAAFTLRLDGDRHLRLRLASAVCRRSSQQLLVEALDKLLQTLPEVEELAVQHSDRAGNDHGHGD